MTRHGKPRSVRGAALLASGTVAVIALGAIGYEVYTSHRGHPAAAATRPVSADPNPARSSHALHAPRPLPPPVPHQFVAPAAPTSFEMKGAGFDIKATACQMDDVLPLDPPGEQEHTVCWVRNTFGVAPGSSSGGTSYILGHSWAENPLEVLNPMSELAMKQVDFQKPHPQSGIPTYPITDLNGYRVILHTSTGVLTYKVADAFAVSKDQAAYVKPLMAATTPNRVVLITCGVLNGVDVDVNIVVDAYLESSTAT